MKVGQTVYIKPIGNKGRFDSTIKESKIAKVGHVYYTLEDERYGRFRIDNNVQDGGQYTPNYKCYLSLQEIEDEKETNNLLSKIKKEFCGYNTRIPLNKLREIAKIIDEL